MFRRSKFKLAHTVPPARKVARTIPLVRDANGAPAVNLTTVSAGGHRDLVKRAQKVGRSLSKRRLAGIRAQAVVILDHSISMSDDYRNGAVQALVERALGFALQIDVDGEVPVIAFDSKVWPTVDVGVHNYKGVVDREVWRPDQMGSTDLAAALRQVQAMAEKTDTPLFVLVITDGEPASRTETTRVVCDLASYPVFIKFVAIRPVDYLQDLDDLDGSQRLLDNVDAKFIPKPAAISDTAFANAMVDEWDSWVEAALKAGVLT